MSGYNSVNKLPSSWNKRQSRTTKNICCSFKWQIGWSTSSRKSGTKEALGHDASDPDGLRQEMWQAVTDGDWEKKRKMNHHLTNAVGRPSFKPSIHRIKCGPPMGTTEVESRAPEIRSGCDPRMWIQGAVLSSHLPLGWGWRLGHNHRIPVIRDLWQTRGQGLLPGLYRFFTPTPTISKKGHSHRLKKTTRCLESFPKREKVQSECLLWKMNNRLPRKKMSRWEPHKLLLRKGRANGWIVPIYVSANTDMWYTDVFVRSTGNPFMNPSYM